MATKKSQRIAISIIAFVMLVGTVGGFIAMMVAPGNEAREKAALETAQKEWQAKNEERTGKVNAQPAELSQKYFADFSGYASRVGAFDAGSVTELKTEDILIGEGDEVKDDTKFAAYYIGWTPNGEIFDQSIVDGKLISPFSIDGPSKTSVIEGWKKGLVGMRIGGVRELTIPSAEAYGEQGSGEKIPANTPLKFVIMAIPAPEAIPEVETPQIIRDYYKRQYGIEI